MMVVMVVNGYSGFYEKGFEIKGLGDLFFDSMNYVFYVGIKVDGVVVLVLGGCVLNVIVCGVFL